MADFVFLALGFLLGMGLVCFVVWRGIALDTWQYDREFLWERYDLSLTQLPDAGK